MRTGREGGSDATSLDQIPIGLMALMPIARVRALIEYMRLLTWFVYAMSNVVLQLSIFKKGPRWLFQSYWPI